MKKFVLIIVISISTYAFSQQHEMTQNPLIKAGVGVFIPQGKLTKYIGISPYFELSLDIPLFNKDIFGVSAQFVIPNQQDEFNYERTTDTIRAKSTLIANITLNLKKIFFDSPKKRLSLNFGIGASSIQTDARNPYYTGEENQDKYEMVSSLLLNPSVEFTKKLKYYNEITIAIGAQYSPYKIEGAIQENIGGFAIIPKFIYKF